MPDPVFLESARAQYTGALETRKLGKCFVLLDEVDSTNAYIRRAADAQAAQGLAVAALRQSAGRGRLGRSWASNGGGLYFSFAVQTPPEMLPRLPLAAALAVLMAFDELGVPDAWIKWPNDILASEKKLVGILCQCWGERAAVGIGVNIGQSEQDFAAAGLPNAASLAMLGIAAEPWRLMARILTHAERCIALAREDIAALLNTYRSRCISLGRALVASGAQGEIHGVGVDIDEEGRLILKTAQGLKAVASGEVKLRGADGYI